MSSAYERAVKLLARREHTRRELERKLARAGGEGSPEVGEALDRLERDGLLSDRRFAEEFVNWRKEAWGDRKISYELGRRGVDKKTAGQVMEAILGDSEAERAVAVLEGKAAGSFGDAKAEAKCRRFLEQRGFGAESIRRAVDAKKCGEG